MPNRILIADDDPGIVDAVEMMLSFYGYEVNYTYNGSDVLKLKPEELPDLLLLDIWMSGVDGRDVCREIKAKAGMCKLPVLMISASKDVAQSALNAGADAFMTKPFDMQQLISNIENLLNRKSEAAVA